MFYVLKKLIAFVWRQKAKLILVFVFAVLFFFIRFPWNDLLEKKAKDFQKKIPSTLQTDFENIHLKLIPPGLEFEDLFIHYKGKSLTFPSIGIFPAFKEWLTLKPAWRVKAHHKNSSLSFVVWKKKKPLKEGPPDSSIDIYFIKGNAPFWELEVLNNLFKVKMSGLARAFFDYKGSLKKFEEVIAFLNLKGTNVQLSGTEFKTALGPLNFPPMKWKEIEIASHLKEGELVFKTFRLGAVGDDFIVRLKGSGALLFSYGKVRLNSYDIQLQMDVDKALSIGILDLMFANFKEDKGSFYRYSLRLRGQGHRVPNMEKLPEF